MRFLAISGSARRDSTNTALLRTAAKMVGPDHSMDVFDGLGNLPVFSPDREETSLPPTVRDFVSAIERSDGLIISSPEYVRAIPGGLKNAIDWLVSRDEIISKPVVLMHASHRGDDVLAQLRLVLSTVSAGFHENIFLRFALIKKTPEEIEAHLNQPDNRDAIADFLRRFAEACASAD